MEMTTAIVICPGQGAQRPRMLTPWIREPAASARLREWSLRAGIDLAALGTEGSMAEISRTENAQPLLVAQALLIMTEVTGRSIAVAGHSVGELSAAAMAGVLEPGEAVFIGASGERSAMGWPWPRPAGRRRRRWRPSWGATPRSSPMPSGRPVHPWPIAMARGRWLRPDR